LGKRLKLNVVIDANHTLLRARHRDLGLLRLLARLQALLARAPLRTARWTNRRTAADLATTWRVLLALRGVFGNDATARPFGKRRCTRRLSLTATHHAGR